MSSSAVWDKLQGLYEEAIDKSFAGAVDEVPSMFPSSFGKANGAKAAKLTSESLARAKALAMDEFSAIKSANSGAASPREGGPASAQAIRRIVGAARSSHKAKLEAIARELEKETKAAKAEASKAREERAAIAEKLDGVSKNFTQV